MSKLDPHILDQKPAFLGPDIAVHSLKVVDPVSGAQSIIFRINGQRWTAHSDVSIEFDGLMHEIDIVDTLPGVPPGTGRPTKVSVGPAGESGDDARGGPWARADSKGDFECWWVAAGIGGNPTVTAQAIFESEGRREFAIAEVEGPIG